VIAAHFGVSLPQAGASFEQVLVAARRYEADGFGSVWVSDHMLMPYGGGADLPIFEAVTELAVVAAHTRRVGLGTNCTNIMFRNPAVFAKEIATLDHASAGRVVPGLGAGYYTPEFIAFGCPPWRQWQRVQALAEAVELVRRLWSGEQVTFEGTYFRVRNAVCAPVPLQARPPLLVGGASATTIRAAACHADIWSNPPLYEGRLVANVARLRSAAADAGRDADEIVVSQRARVAIGSTEAAARSELATMVAKTGPGGAAAVEEHGIWGTPERVCERIEAYTGQGCSHFVIDFYGHDPDASAALFAAEVLSQIHSR
jgi:alkanesulfonate monooxygenase SsuD/methylene tetrahydromethanopterin reductase-like flavin-dependent oxidoreductase (luciferase family)